MTDTRSREALIKELRMIEPLSHGHFSGVGNRAADMLEADANLRTQLARRTVERDMAISMGVEGDAQQVAVPMTLTDAEIDAVTLVQWGEMHGQPLAAHRAFARAIEAMLAAAPKGDAPCNA